MQFERFFSKKRQNTNKEILLNKAIATKKIIENLANLATDISSLKTEIGNINAVQETAKQSIDKRLAEIMAQSRAPSGSMEEFKKNWSGTKVELLKFLNESEKRNNLVKSRIRTVEQKHLEAIGPAWESDIYKVIEDNAKKCVAAIDDLKQRIHKSDERIKEMRRIAEILKTQD